MTEAVVDICTSCGQTALIKEVNITVPCPLCGHPRDTLQISRLCSNCGKSEIIEERPLGQGCSIFNER